MAETLEKDRFLLFRAGPWTCALPLRHVLETMRALPVEAVNGMPPFVRGLSVVRGRPTPVVELAALLGGSGGGESRRLVTVQVEGRQVALAVDEVLGVSEVAESTLGRLPFLLEDAAGGLIEALGTLDSKLLLVLRAGRVLSGEPGLPAPAGGQP